MWAERQESRMQYDGLDFVDENNALSFLKSSSKKSSDALIEGPIAE